MRGGGPLWLAAACGLLAAVLLAGALLLPKRVACEPACAQVAFDAPVTDKSCPEMGVFRPDSEVE